MENLTYWTRQEKDPLYPDILWNKPEQKSHAGKLAVIGGNSNSFHSVAQASTIASSLGVGEVISVLPASLKSKLPHTPSLAFADATTTGSFSAKAADALIVASDSTDSTLLIGDLSRNSETTTAISQFIASTTKPIVITRDAVDILATTPNAINRDRITILTSMPQLQALFRALFYPKPLLLSQPLIPVIETLHKFTISYPTITIATLHREQLIIAHDANITTTDIKNTNYSPMSMWSGQLATTIAALQLWNPTKPLEATTTAILYPAK